MSRFSGNVSCVAIAVVLCLFIVMALALNQGTRARFTQPCIYAGCGYTILCAIWAVLVM